MSFCLPFAYYKEWQEAKQQEKEDLEQPLLAAPTVSPRGGGGYLCGQGVEFGTLGVCGGVVIFRQLCGG